MWKYLAPCASASFSDPRLTAIGSFPRKTLLGRYYLGLLKVAPLRRGLILVDRARVQRRWIRHANGRRHHARLDGRLAAQHAAVEFLERRKVYERPGIGCAALV